MGGDPARSLVSLPVGRGCSPGPGHRAASAPLSRRNPPLSTAWSRRMDREPLALENKQHRFCAPSCRDSHGSTRGVDHCELEMASFASFTEIKDSKEGMEDGTEQIARDTAVPNALGAIPKSVRLTSNSPFAMWSTETYCCVLQGRWEVRRSPSRCLLLHRHVVCRSEPRVDANNCWWRVLPGWPSNTTVLRHSKKKLG